MPAPPADPHTLLRRVTLDLTGLPPTPDEVDAFLADRSPDAYERVVDRLLASPRYGERMAIRWLDAARYADTNGYQSDGERHMWRWRDWVIEALQRQHAVRSVHDRATRRRPAAGADAATSGSPPASTATIAATPKGGIIPEEYAVEYVVDRVETTATVWLGLTLGCARCHDHKYDPFTQTRVLPACSPSSTTCRRTGGRSRSATRRRTSRPRRRSSSERARRSWSGEPRDAKRAFAGGAKLTCTCSTRMGTRGSLQDRRPIGIRRQLALMYRSTDSAIDKLAATPTTSTGMVGQAAQFDGSACRSAGDVGDFRLLRQVHRFGRVDPVRAGGGGTIVSRMTDVAQGDGYQLALVERQAAAQPRQALARRRRCASRRRSALAPERWHHVAASPTTARASPRA